jgi:O-antigen/teichoic acid export membrane protein
VVTAFTVLNGVLMARLLGPAGRGAVFATVVFPTAAAALVGSFAYPVLARRAAAAREGSPRLNGFCLLATLPLAVATALTSALIILMAGSQLDAGQRRAAILYAILWSPTSLLILNFQAIDLGRARWRRYNVLRLLPYPLILAGLLACFGTGRRDPEGVLLVLLASNLGPIAVRVWLARREGGFASVARSDLLDLYREALPFVAASGGAAALAYADQLVAATVLPPAEAGLYAVAQRAGLLMTPMAAAAGAVSFSEAARQPAGVTASQPWRRTMVMAMVASCAVLAVAVWFLVPVLYGRAFTGARTAAVLALVAGLLAALADLRELRLEGAGVPLRVVPGRLAGAAALAAVAAAAGLRWGPAGIVAASIVGQGLRSLVREGLLAAGRVRS